MEHFDHVSKDYGEKSLVQAKAAEKLIRLLEPEAKDSILDVACGPGHVTAALRKLTRGRVVGTDISEGMIRQAKQDFPRIEFQRVAAEYLEFREEFDIVFCNSALQWFREPQKALLAMHAALRRPGQIGIAGPATREWSPFFERILAKIRDDERIRATFAHWKSPWFFLNEADEYRALFEQNGFRTTWFELAHEADEYTIDQAYQVYLTGAGVGFTDPACYDVPIDEAFVKQFNDLVRAALFGMAKGGKVEVDFNRLYYVGAV